MSCKPGFMCDYVIAQDPTPSLCGMHPVSLFMLSLRKSHFCWQLGSQPLLRTPQCGFFSFCSWPFLSVSMWVSLCGPAPPRDHLRCSQQGSWASVGWGRRAGEGRLVPVPSGLDCELRRRRGTAGPRVWSAYGPAPCRAFPLCKGKGRARTGSLGAHTGSREESEKGLVCK